MKLATMGLWFIAWRHGTRRRAKRQDLWSRARCHGPRCQALAMSPSQRHPRQPLPLISMPKPTASRRVTLAPWVTVPSLGSKSKFRRPSCINVSSIFKPLKDRRDRHYRCWAWSKKKLDSSQDLLGVLFYPNSFTLFYVPLSVCIFLYVDLICKTSNCSSSYMI